MHTEAYADAVYQAWDSWVGNLKDNLTWVERQVKVQPDELVNGSEWRNAVQTASQSFRVHWEEEAQLLLGTLQDDGPRRRALGG